MEKLTMEKVTMEKMTMEKLTTEKVTMEKMTMEKLTMEIMIMEKKSPETSMEISTMDMDFLNFHKKLCSWVYGFIIACFIVVAFLSYGYLLITLKTTYYKTKRLERIGLMAMQNEKLMCDIHLLDQNIAQKLGELDEMYTDF